MSNFSKINPAVAITRMPKNGIASSEQTNDFIEQAIQDIGQLIYFINTTAIPIFDGLGAPGTYADLNVVTNGLNGKTLIINPSQSDLADTYLWSTSKNRPKTLYESIIQIGSDITDAYGKINEINARLGTAVEASDGAGATLTELETRVNNQIQLLSQLESQIDGFATLTEISNAITNETITPILHVTDVDVDSLAGIAPTKISGIDFWTNPYSISGIDPSIGPYTLNDTVQRMAVWIENITGDTFTQWSGLNVSGPTLRAHIGSTGTGVVSSGNPHGLDIADLSDGGGLLQKPQLIGSFDFKTSGNSSYNGGYVYVAGDFTLTRFSITLGIPGTSGITSMLYKRTSGGSTILLNSGLSVGASPTPGSASAVLAGATASLGDMLFLSGVSGDGLNARAFVFGRP